MPHRPPAHWIIRVDETSGERTHSVWHGDECIAAGIRSIEDARMIRKAPELYALARSLDEVIAPPADSDYVAPFPQRKPPRRAPRRGKASVESVEVAAPARPAMASRQRPFDEVFQAAVDQIYRDAKASRLPLIRLAEEAGISRAQFARWKKKTPLTIKLVTELQALARSGGKRKD
jgi:hypothetical protein